MLGVLLVCLLTSGADGDAASAQHFTVSTHVSTLVSEHNISLSIYKPL